MRTVKELAAIILRGCFWGECGSTWRNSSKEGRKQNCVSKVPVMQYLTPEKKACYTVIAMVDLTFPIKC